MQLTFTVGFFFSTSVFKNHVQQLLHETKETTSDEQMLSAVLSLTWQHTTLSCTHTHELTHIHTHTRQSQITNKVASISKCLLFWHWTKIHQLIMCCEKQKLPQCSVHKREANQQVWTWPHFIQFLEQNKCKFFSK